MCESNQASGSTEFLSVEDLAKRWHMKTWGVRNRISRKLPMPGSFHFPGGKRRLFRLSDVETWEKENAVYAPSPQKEPRRTGRPTKRERRAQASS